MLPLLPALLLLLVLASQQPQVVPRSQAQVISNDEKWFAFSVDDGTIHIVALPEGQSIQVLTGLSKSCTSLEFGPDGSTIVSSTADGTRSILPLSLSYPARQVSPEGNTAQVWSASSRLVDGGSKLLVAGGGARIRLLNMGDGALVREWSLATDELTEYWAGVSACVVSADGKHGSLGSHNGRVGLYSMSSGVAELGPWQLPRPVSLLALDQEAHRLAIVTSDCTVRVRTLEANCKMTEFSHADQNMFGDLEICSMCFSEDGRHLLTATCPYWEVRLWDVETGRREWAYDFGGGNPTAISARFTPDGATVLVSKDNLRLDALTGLARLPLVQEQRRQCRTSGRTAWRTIGSKLEIYDMRSWNLLCTIPLTAQAPEPR